MPRLPYTPEDHERILRMFHEDYNTRAIALYLRRSESSIRNKLSEMHLRRRTKGTTMNERNQELQRELASLNEEYQRMMDKWNQRFDPHRPWWKKLLGIN